MKGAYQCSVEGAHDGYGVHGRDETEGEPDVDG